MNKIILNNMKKRNYNLSKYACKDSSAIRFYTIEDSFRTPFFRDVDKIIYALSYTRYIDKTQVFSNNDNDMISKRMTHVQMVSRIARTIGRALNLNEDLIEAASLGHDLGHVPFGHTGEKILNKISLKNNQGCFLHNVQSVRTLMYLENRGNGLNVTLQVLDAILCHNGEQIKQIYEPLNKNKQIFLEQYNNSYNYKNKQQELNPMTLEGCIVRISDVIAYVGKDIEDAVRIGKIEQCDIPKEITDILGTNNSDIINTIVIDIINNSINNNYIKMSSKIFDVLQKLIKFNYDKIYNKAISEDKLNKLELMFNNLFELYCKHLKNNQIKEDIYTYFLNEMCDEYLTNTTTERKVIDFISGMTDDFFMNQYNKYFN